MAVLELLALLTLVVVGVVVIALIGAFLFLLPAFVIAGLTWWLSGGHELLTGVAFLAVALISLVKRR